jgi:hypothetical protein
MRKENDEFGYGVVLVLLQGGGLVVMNDNVKLTHSIVTTDQSSGKPSLFNFLVFFFIVCNFFLID